jgi:predicted nuclease with TOPRIM domain
VGANLLQEISMVKRRITLTSQEMSGIEAKIKTLESQLTRSNGRVDELEHGLSLIDKLVTKKAKPKTVDAVCTAVEQLTKITLNPPVKAKELANELANEAVSEETVD